MDIIDFHTHLWPDKIAEKAKEYLEKSFKMPMTAVPVEKNVLKEMDENGITKSVIASVASRPDQVEHINNWLFRLNPERFIKFASLHPFYEKWSYELDRIKDNAQGIKIQPEFQMFYIDDERVFPMYEKIQKLQIPLLFHCGYELSTGLIQAGPPATASPGPTARASAKSWSAGRRSPAPPPNRAAGASFPPCGRQTVFRKP